MLIIGGGYRTYISINLAVNSAPYRTGTGSAVAVFAKVFMTALPASYSSASS